MRLELLPWLSHTYACMLTFLQHYIQQVSTSVPHREVTLPTKVTDCPPIFIFLNFWIFSTLHIFSPVGSSPSFWPRFLLLKPLLSRKPFFFASNIFSWWKNLLLQSQQSCCDACQVRICPWDTLPAFHRWKKGLETFSGMFIQQKTILEVKSFSYLLEYWWFCFTTEILFFSL